MMKQFIYRTVSFAFYDRAAIVKTLEKMAARGWMVDKIGSFLWRYRRIPAQRLHFSVVYVPKASEFDPHLTESQLQLMEFCARDGWQSAARWGQMQIFYNEGEDPAPIETDAVTQVENICQSMRRGVIPGQLLMILLGIFQLTFQYWRFTSDPIYFLSEPTALYLTPMWVVILLAALYELIYVFYWSRKARAAAESGEFFELRTKKIASLLIVFLACLFCLMIFASSRGVISGLIGVSVVALAFFISNLTTKFLKKRGVSRRVNLIVSCFVCVVVTCSSLLGFGFAIIQYDIAVWIDEPSGTYELFPGFEIDVYDHPVPLHLEDLMEIPKVNWSTQKTESRTLMAASTEYNLRPLTEDREIPDLKYTVTEIKLDFLYQITKKAVMNTREDVVKDGEVIYMDHYEPVDAVLWGADEAYGRILDHEREPNEFLLCYGDRLVEFKGYWTPITPEQMATVGQLLGE